MTQATDTLLHEALLHERLGEPAKARDCLDKLLLHDPDNHLAWYQKSRLALLQSDDVSLDGHIVSIARYQSLPTAERRDYLRQCGFDIVDIDDAEARLRLPNLLADQRMRFLSMAAQIAPPASARLYRAEISTLTKRSDDSRRRDHRVVLSVGLAALLVAIAAAVTVALSWFPGASYSQFWCAAPLLAAYVLSITGMSAFVHARDRLNATPTGLAVNLAALVVAILSVVTLIIHLIIK